MRDYLLLMHDDATDPVPPDRWAGYFSRLRAQGMFDAGSAIGDGRTFRKHGDPGKANRHITGYIRIRADSFDDAGHSLAGDPVFECGGAVEIRELPRG